MTYYQKPFLFRLEVHEFLLESVLELVGVPAIDFGNA